MQRFLMLILQSWKMYGFTLNALDEANCQILFKAKVNIFCRRQKMFELKSDISCVCVCGVCASDFLESGYYFIWTIPNANSIKSLVKFFKAHWKFNCDSNYRTQESFRCCVLLHFTQRAVIIKFYDLYCGFHQPYKVFLGRSTIKQINSHLFNFNRHICIKSKA